MEKNKTLLTTENAAEYLDLKKQTLEIWRVYGKGPKFLKIGRSVRYRKADLDTYLENSVQQSTSGYKNA